MPIRKSILFLLFFGSFSRFRFKFVRGVRASHIDQGRCHSDMGNIENIEFTGLPSCFVYPHTHITRDATIPSKYMINVTTQE